MLDWDRLDELFDASNGEPAVSLALFDRRVLFPLEMVPEMVKRETGHELAVEQLMELAEQGWFGVSQDGVAGDAGGVPLYVVSRIGMSSAFNSMAGPIRSSVLLPSMKIRWLKISILPTNCHTKTMISSW